MILRNLTEKIAQVTPDFILSYLYRGRVILISAFEVRAYLLLSFKKQSLKMNIEKSLLASIPDVKCLWATHHIFSVASNPQGAQI